MALFESEIQELMYELLVGDSILLAYLGGDSIDTRVRLSPSDLEPPKISTIKPAYIIIETRPAPAPIHLGSGVDEWTEQYCLHIFTKIENRDLRAAIEGRLRELLHRKSFITACFIVYNVLEGGRDGVITETGLFDYRYVVSFQFLSKDS
ncbi:MAG: hypothetical protein JW765_09820 [Deltaproteobacteria bacterium]|nr:hypothetical protein [Candidatus Zymogenaceae bacterium]